MLKVALTGNIGSGKTLICRFFEILGIPVFYADAEAKKLYENKNILLKVKQEFGDQILTSQGNLDKTLLAEKIFTNKENLKKINRIIHPEVFKIFEEWINNQKNKPYVIQEAAILFETGGYKRFDKTILVYAPYETLVERVMKRDGLKRQEVLNRLHNQMDQEQKKQLADYLLLNDNSQLLIPQILKLHQQLTELS
ncbi:MAG: dephospho-CoA kinase [Bacteroidetes bacterium]|nr:MAG: dephospho-CoA kinase [Bacteroidota bacterium]